MLLGTFQIAVLLSAVAIAQPAPQWSARIAIDVSAPSESLKSLLASYVSREFRSLGDVEVGDDPAAGFVLRLSITTLHNAADGGLTGYAVSAWMSEAVPTETVLSVVETKNKPVVQYLIAGSEQYITNWLYVSPREGLRDLCQKLVARIDDRIFAERRRAYQRVKAVRP